MQPQGGCAHHRSPGTNMSTDSPFLTLSLSSSKPPPEPDLKKSRKGLSPSSNMGMLWVPEGQDKVACGDL